jgi:hypothetical protein
LKILRQNNEKPLGFIAKKNKILMAVVIQKQAIHSTHLIGYKLNRWILK